MNEKTKLICVTIIVGIAIISLTLAFLATNTYNIHFSMDNNTLEAVKNINWSMVK